MARTLGETIKQNLGAKQQAEATDNTGAAKKLLRGKMGKAGGTALPSSSLAEQQGVAATQSNLDQQATQGMAQSRSIDQAQRAGEMKQENTLKDMDQQRDQVAQQLSQQTTSLLNNLERSGKELDVNRDGSAIEQLGFDIAMNDKKYMADLASEGKRNRLTNDLSFKEGMQKAAFEDMESILKDDLTFKKMMGADKRAFNEEMSRMDVTTAMGILQDQISSAGKQRMIEGVGEMGTEGLKYGAKKYAESSSS